MLFALTAGAFGVSQPFQALVGCVFTFAAQCFPAGRGKEANPCTHPPLATLLAYLYLLYNLPTRLFLFFLRLGARCLPRRRSSTLHFSLCSSLFSLRVCSVDFQLLACFLNPVRKNPARAYSGAFFSILFFSVAGRCAWRRRTLQLLQIADVQFFCSRLNSL